MAYTPNYVTYSTVTEFVNDFRQAHPDLQTNSTNGRIPLNKPLVLARMMDELVRLGLADGRENPLGHAKALLNGKPSIMVTERRYPVEEAQELYKTGYPVPLPVSNEHAAQDDGSHGDPGEGDQSQSQGENQSQGEGQGQGEGENQSQDQSQDQSQNQSDGQGEGEESEGEESDGEGESEIPISQPQPQPNPANDDEEPDENSLLGKILKAMRYTFVKHKMGGFINLVGPAGLGKTFQVRKACKILDAEIFVQTAVDTTSELVGSLRLVEQNGASITEFAPSELVRGLMYAQEHPDRRVVILQDEYDCLPNDVKTKLNSLLAPPFVLSVKGGTVGDIPMGPNVVFVAISNTAGHGGDEVYPDRQLVDMSTMDRFFFNITATFEQDVALKIADGDVDLVNFILDYNRSVDKARQDRFKASYRTIESAIANRIAGFSREDFMPTLTKLATEMEVAQLYEGLDKKTGKWPIALHRYLKSLSPNPMADIPDDGPSEEDDDDY